MTVPKRLFWTTFGTGVIAAVTIVTLLLWIVAMTDDVAAIEMHKRVDAAVQEKIKRNALVTEDYAHWTTAWEWYADGDDDALYENLGSGASDSETFEFMFFVTADGTPTHAYVSDVETSDLGNYDATIGAAALAAFGTPTLLPYQTASGLVQVGDDVAVFTAARIQPDDITGLAPTDLPIMIGGFWLDPDRIAAAFQIDGLVLQPLDASAATDSGQSRLVLTGIDGTPLAQLSWTAPRPGLALLANVAPVISLLVVLIMVVSWSIGRVTAGQTAAYLRERVSARTDPATRLLNRTGLYEEINSPALQEHLKQGRVALIYVDLNGLKALNDTYGHSAGDAAIAITALRLTEAVRRSDKVARLGGDEFICLIVDEDPQMAARRIAARVAELTAPDFSYAGRKLPAKAAIGIAFSDQSKNWDTLLSQADAAMYEAKRANHAAPVVFGENIKLAV